MNKQETQLSICATTKELTAWLTLIQAFKIPITISRFLLFMDRGEDQIWPFC